MIDRTTPDKSPAPENGQTLAADHPDANSLTALIEEAVALHGSVSDAKTRGGRLVVALRRYRRRERLVSNTLASLKALKLQEVAR